MLDNEHKIKTNNLNIMQKEMKGPLLNLLELFEITKHSGMGLIL